MSRGIKKTNEYQKLLSPEFLEKCPKSVLAAIAVSYALNYVNVENPQDEILKEWGVLFQNGIVSQKPYKQ